MKVVIVNGYPLAGKDTFCEFCCWELTRLKLRGQIVSSIQPAKEAARILGWDGAKDAKGRAFLSDLKDLSIQAYDGPLNYLRRCVTTSDAAALFMMIREPEEIQKAQREFNAITVLVHRGQDNSAAHSNHADAGVEGAHYARVILNTGSLQQLREKASAFTNLYLLPEGRHADRKDC